MFHTKVAKSNTSNCNTHLILSAGMKKLSKLTSDNANVSDIEFYQLISKIITQSFIVVF